MLPDSNEANFVSMFSIRWIFPGLHLQSLANKTALNKIFEQAFYIKYVAFL